MKYDWCWKIKDPEKGWEVDFCENWMCHCGHAFSSHLSSGPCYYKWGWCDCTEKMYLHNNNCSMWCVFQRKLMEVEEAQ